jgi:hypothetical protein
MDHSSRQKWHHYISMAVEPVSVAFKTHTFNKVSDLVTMVGVSKSVPYQRHHP